MVELKIYYHALVNAWKEYWGEVPPWYASLENLKPYIDAELSKALGRSVSLSLEEHLKYIKELYRQGKVDYWYGGLDPKRRHWVAILGLTFGPIRGQQSTSLTSSRKIEASSWRGE